MVILYGMVLNYGWMIMVPHFSVTHRTAWKTSHTLSQHPYISHILSMSCTYLFHHNINIHFLISLIPMEEDSCNNNNSHLHMVTHHTHSNLLHFLLFRLEITSRGHFIVYKWMQIHFLSVLWGWVRLKTHFLTLSINSSFFFVQEMDFFDNNDFDDFFSDIILHQTPPPTPFSSGSESDHSFRASSFPPTPAVNAAAKRSSPRTYILSFDNSTVVPATPEPSVPSSPLPAKRALNAQNPKTRPNQGSKRSRTSSQTIDHIMAERRRRQELSERFIALSATIPGLNKVL